MSGRCLWSVWNSTSPRLRRSNIFPHSEHVAKCSFSSGGSFSYSSAVIVSHDSWVKAQPVASLTEMLPTWAKHLHSASARWRPKSRVTLSKHIRERPRNCRFIRRQSRTIPLRAFVTGEFVLAWSSLDAAAQRIHYRSRARASRSRCPRHRKRESRHHVTGCDAARMSLRYTEMAKGRSPHNVLATLL